MHISVCRPLIKSHGQGLVFMSRMRGSAATKEISPYAHFLYACVCSCQLCLTKIQRERCGAGDVGVVVGSLYIVRHPPLQTDCRSR